MSLKQWADNGFLKAHGTSRQEIGDLLAAVRRDRLDATKDLSPDSAFGIAYSAALRLCTIALYASGYRTQQGRHHYYTIQALPHILGPGVKELRDYLQSCTKKRNIATYESVGAISTKEAAELLAAVVELEPKVVEWLRTNHPQLLP